jgi:RecA-family ATPase
MTGPFNPADWDYFPPGEPSEPIDLTSRRGGQAKALGKPKMAIEWFSEAADSALEEPANQLIEDLLDEGAMSVIYGDSGSGKTFVALDMGFHVGAGLDWNGKKVTRGLVVYVAAEGGRRIKRRIAALKKRYREEFGEHAVEPLFALVRYQIDLRSSDADLNSLVALVRDAEKETGEKCVWLIVDTLSRAMAGGDENSPVDMGRIVASADRFRAETAAHFTYVHHTGKDRARILYCGRQPIRKSRPARSH